MQLDVNWSYFAGQDPYWDKLLRHCCDNNSYQGCPPPERQDLEEEDYAQLENLNLSYGIENPTCCEACGESFRSEEIPKCTCDEAPDGWE